MARSPQPGALDGICVVDDNVEATEAWNGPLFDIWMEFRDLVADGLREHGEAALAAAPPRAGDRVLDIGCGLGDTTVRLAELVGPQGQAHGVDVAERMIETAVAEAAVSGVDSVSFAACDVETRWPTQTRSATSCAMPASSTSAWRVRTCPTASATISTTPSP